MTAESTIQRILSLYPADVQPRNLRRFVSPEGFSGAALWRLDSSRGPLCLRRWPTEHPDDKRLEFIQAVLWHVHQEGFQRVPLPLETRHHHGFVRHEGHLWELAPWLSGAADFRRRPSPTRLENALTALAEFHRAAASFPLADPGLVRSPGMIERLGRLGDLLHGGVRQFREALTSQAWPELATRAAALLSAFERLGPRWAPLLQRAAILPVPLQPCIRDIWHAHVLFADDEVTGLVDFGSLRPENVAADVARLLGSMALDETHLWQHGLAAYQSVRPLSREERLLVDAFDRSTVLMGGLQWLDWIYLQGRQFDNPKAVLARLDEFLARTEALANQSVEPLA